MMRSYFHRMMYGDLMRSTAIDGHAIKVTKRRRSISEIHDENVFNALIGSAAERKAPDK